ncbi:hypothetical protein ACJJTC_013889 [Scirpophaga incertulas]
MISFYFCVLVTSSLIWEIICTSSCTVTDVKSLVVGYCDRLTGLNLTSVGGTMVNDHNCDVLLPKQVFIEEPVFQYPMADTKKFYTIIMVDPDAAPRMEGEFYVHLMKSNIPGLALKSKDNSKTIGIYYRAFKPPTPPRGTGAHRYISLVFVQRDGNNFLPTLPQMRSRFMLSSWLRGKNLCGPVAGTAFRAQF